MKGLLGIALAFLVAFGAGPSPAAEIPRPSLERVDPLVREQLSGARLALDARLASQGSERELAVALGKQGELYLAYDFLAAAAACFAAAHERQPEAFRWAYLLGYTEERRGEQRAAFTAYKAALAIDPSVPVALLRLGLVELALGLDVEAKPRFELALRKDGECVGALNGLGELARRAGEHLAATEFFRRVLDERPDAHHIHYPLALSLRQLGRLEEARAELDKASFEKSGLGAWVGCADPYSGDIWRHVTGAAALILRGVQAGASGNKEGEVAAYRQAIAANPNDPVAHKSLAAALYFQQDLKGAARHFREAVRLDPDDASYRNGLGQVLLLLGEVAEAVGLLRSATEINPAYKEPHLKLADVYLQNRRFEQAIGHSRSVLAVDPLHRQARIQLAMALLQSGQSEEARRELAEALDNGSPADPVELLHLSTLISTLGDTERGMRHLRAVLGMEAPAGVHAQAHLRLAQIQAQADDRASALTSLRAALALDPGLEPAKQALAQLEGSP